jgi:leader peptidase (prepilin peptidase)/N-methyltransferase
VYRLAVPAGAAPRDTCPHCHGLLPVGWRGWVRPSGRCPACQAVLAAHLWAYVAVSAGVFAVLGWRLPLGRPADAALAVAWFVLAAVGAVLAGIDVRVNRLPRPTIAGAACVVGPLVAVAAVSAGDPGLVVRAAAVAVVLGAVYLALALVGPGLVGLGDVYLAALVGLLLGTGPVAAILAGALLPYLLAVPVTLVRLLRRRIRKADQIAWGPFLLLGAIIAKALIP